MTFVSYAQNFEDVLLWRALHEVERGGYLDIGAQDPVIDSVSLAFYEAGWRGIHVEPTPFYAGRLREARPDELVIEAAVTDAAGPIEFYLIPNTGLSTGIPEVASRQADAGFPARKIVVPCVRLDQLLERAQGELHWLKIDVEGMEADVLRSWRRSKRRPWLLVVESTFPGTQQPTEQLWIEEVLQRGYRQVFFDGLSRYFLHESRNELADRFGAPVNVFDGFTVTASHFAARDVAASFTAELENARAAGATNAAHLRAELDHSRNITSAVSEERDSARAALEAAVIVRDEATVERDLARQNEAAVQARLAASEQEHRTALNALWRERQSAEEDLRLAAFAMEQRLRDELEQVKAEAAEGRVQLARLEERSSQQAEILRLSEMATREACVRYQDAQQQVGQLRLLLEQRASSIERVDLLIHALLTEQAGRWQALGHALGMAKPSRAVEALSEWTRLKHETPATPDNRQPIISVDPRTSILEPLAAEQGNAYLRASSLPELLSWHDQDFVRCAYVTILGRQPDPEGEAYYTRRIRHGHSKLELLWNLRRSEEGRQHDPGIAGLDRELRRASLARRPVVGWLARRLSRLPGDSASQRQIRALENALQVLARNQQAGFRELMTTISTKVLQSPAQAGPSRNEQAQSDHPPAAVTGLSERASEIFLAMSRVR